MNNINSINNNDIRYSTDIEMCNPLYQRINSNEDNNFVPYEIINAEAIIIDNKIYNRNEKIGGTYVTNINEHDNPNIFARVASDDIHRKIINGSYIDGSDILKIDNNILKLSKPIAERQSEIQSNNTLMANILDEVAQDPSRILVKPSFNSSLPTYEIGINNNNNSNKQDKPKEYEIEEYESIYDNPNNPNKGYVIEEYKSIYE